MRLALILLLTLQASSWTPLGTWTGDGSKQTESFTTTQREWRIRWTLHNPKDPKSFAVSIHHAADDALVTMASGQSNDETYVRTPPGRYYLSVLSVNTAWTVVAEEAR